MLMDTIINPKYTQRQFEFFKQKIGSDYVDQSLLYRLSVKFQKPELTKLILHSGKFDINNGELYLEVSAAVMFDNEEIVIQHIQNGYIPTEHEVNGILETYNEVGINNRNKDLYHYFKGLLKNKSNKNEL